MARYCISAWQRPQLYSGLTRTVYIHCIIGNLPAKNTVYTPYTYIWFWPTLGFCITASPHTAFQPDHVMLYTAAWDGRVHPTHVLHLSLIACCSAAMLHVLVDTAAWDGRILHVSLITYYISAWPRMLYSAAWDSYILHSACQLDHAIHLSLTTQCSTLEPEPHCACQPNHVLHLSLSTFCCTLQPKRAAYCMSA